MNNEIKKMFEEIKEIRNDNHFFDVSNDLNTFTLNLDLTKGQIYRDYSNKSLIDSNVYDYIEETYDTLYKSGRKFRLNIIFPADMDDDEKSKIIKLLKIHYSVQYEKCNKEFIKTNIRALILLLFGALLYALYAVVLHYTSNRIVDSIVEIFAWVFIWQSCFEFFFTNAQIRKDRIYYLKLYNIVSFK